MAGGKSYVESFFFWNYDYPFSAVELCSNGMDFAWIWVNTWPRTLAAAGGIFGAVDIRVYKSYKAIQWECIDAKRLFAYLTRYVSGQTALYCGTVSLHKPL